LSLAGTVVPARGFVAVVPGFSDAGPLLEHARDGSARGVRGRILAGELDPSRDLAVELSRNLNERGVNCRIEVVPGLEHDFPHDFESRLPELLLPVLA
jgi:acetyl esterase/lipase